MKLKRFLPTFLLGMCLGCVALGSTLFYFDVLAWPSRIRAFPIRMEVDFGPAGKPSSGQTLYVETGSTPKEAVSQVFPILSGMSCCSVKEVLSIDGVRVEPLKSLWWVCLLNGSKNISPQKKKLKAGDVVEWKFIHEVRPKITSKS